MASILLSRQSFCHKKNDTCSSSCQWQNMAGSREDRYAGTPAAVSTQSVPLFYHDKSMLVVTNKCLSRQMFCCDKHRFVMASILLLRQKLCRKSFFLLVAAPANDRIWQGVVRIGTLVHQWQSVLRVYHSFIMTKVCLSWQTSVCRNKCFVATNIILSWQAYFCCDKKFVVIFLMLVAAPANDRIWLWVVRIGTLVHQWQSVLGVYYGGDS